ncbi:MAG TPA: 23S rRNA (pseudouridine(1915)-N(3))-methyltransferase RlmH [Chitinophagaceae bacterium]|nr:23S rRNA (pseudouridine(1915)-N(3))-methyltransferase RlmH [Chitinophagaceae bacterium]
MNIELWTLGKEQSNHLDLAIAEYCKRLNHYSSFKIITIDNSKLNKSLSKNQLLDKEAELILAKLTERDYLVCLDEHGKSFTSIQFANQLNSIFNQSNGKLIFLIGGSFGISPLIKTKARLLLRLSDFTFPHQLVRLIFTEQLYRAMTILKNEKYHHE